MAISSGAEAELQGDVLWRRQCVRNLMDCYGLCSEVLRIQGYPAPGDPWEVFNDCAQMSLLLMDGVYGEMPGVGRLYRDCARLCESCARACRGANAREIEDKSSLFRIYAMIFKEMSIGAEGKEG